MQIIETYGKYIEKWANTNPDRASIIKTWMGSSELKI